MPGGHPMAAFAAGHEGSWLLHCVWLKLTLPLPCALCGIQSARHLRNIVNACLPWMEVAYAMTYGKPSPTSKNFSATVASDMSIRRHV